MADEIMETTTPESEIAEAPVEEAVETTETDETETTEAAPEPEVKTEPEIGHPRWNEVYWKTKQAERELKAEREARERIEKEFREFKDGFEKNQIEFIEDKMREAAALQDLDAYDRLSRQREVMATKKPESVTPLPTVTPGEEYATFFLSQKENMALVLEESKGGSRETGERIHAEMQSNPVWGRAYFENPEEYWAELTRRVDDSKPKKSEPGSAVEGVQPGQAKPQPRWTLQKIADKEGGTVEYIKHIAENMYPNESTPEKKWQRYIENYVKYTVGG